MGNISENYKRIRLQKKNEENLFVINKNKTGVTFFTKIICTFDLFNSSDVQTCLRNIYLPEIALEAPYV